MTTRRQGFMALMAVGLAIGWAGAGVADAATGGLPLCQADLATRTTALATCNGELATCTTALGTCPGELAICTDALAAAQKFPATGQTTCYDSSNVATDCANTSGQDGNIRAGAALSYTSNADGTITDNNTGLVWEKKTTTCSGDIHCVDDAYPWANAFTDFIAVLNTDPCFAGHCDWRLPNVKELQSIVDYERCATAAGGACADSAAIDPVFGDTQASGYWSSTTDAIGPASAWFVFFFDGDVGAFGKTNGFFVRAVRGGL